MRTRGCFYNIAVIYILLAVCYNCAFAGRIIYVDDDAVGANDGSSWQNAYIYLQDAFADANSSEKPVEIRVAQGIYKPDQGAGQTAGDRNATFQLINDTTLSGSYAGVNGINPDGRDYEKYKTILSGDLAGNDVDVNELVDLLTEPTREDNSFHVITGTGTDETAIIMCLTITGGNASSGSTMQGGGIYCEVSNFYEKGGSPTIIQCTLKHNSAHSNGGGISNCGGIISECVIIENIATGTGGGLDNCGNVMNCEIKYNSASFGGGLCKCNIISHCIISSNNADFNGGGILAQPIEAGISAQSFNGDITGTTTVENCIICGNYAGNVGGGLFECSNITNCTIASNKAKNFGGGVYQAKYNSKIINSILWANIAAQGNHVALSGYTMSGAPGVVVNFYGTISFQYSSVQGGEEAIYKQYEQCDVRWMEGNIETEPLFVNIGYWDPNGTHEDTNDDFWIEGDYHLKSQAGRFDPNTQTWIQDDVTSPCIDAGDPNSQIGYEPFPNGGYINMGAYGGTSEASKSYFGKPVCETIIAGDINGDCKVDELDWEIMMLHWLEEY